MSHLNGSGWSLISIRNDTPPSGMHKSGDPDLPGPLHADRLPNLRTRVTRAEYPGTSLTRANVAARQIPRSTHDRAVTPLEQARCSQPGQPNRPASHLPGTSSRIEGQNMATPGPKRRMTAAMRVQLAEMRDRGMSQAEIARAFGLSQQTISRELAKLEREPERATMGDPADVVAFVNNHDNGLMCLRAITQHYRKIVGKVPDEKALEWREKALTAYRAKFRMELVEWQ